MSKTKRSAIRFPANFKKIILVAVFLVDKGERREPLIFESVKFTTLQSSGFPGQVGDMPTTNLNKNVIDIHLIAIGTCLCENLV